MSKSAVNKKTKEKRIENAVKKARLKTIVIVSICALIIIVAVIFTR